MPVLRPSPIDPKTMIFFLVHMRVMLCIFKTNVS